MEGEENVSERSFDVSSSAEKTLERITEGKMEKLLRGQVYFDLFIKIGKFDREEVK